MSKNVDTESDSEESGIFADMFMYILKVAVCVGILYVCGWNILWESDLNTNKNYLVESSKFAIRVNDLYYGGFISSRYFESLVISWISFSIVLSILTPFRLFFFFGKN